MFKLILKKIFISFFSIFIVMSITFVLMKTIPGDPFTTEQNMTKEVMDSLYSHYGLDKPLYIQYFKYIKSFFKLDFGSSFIYEGRTVNKIIKDGFPISLFLGMEALLICIPVGTFLGSLAAFKKNKKTDALIMTIAIIGISLPAFLFATLLQYFFSVKLKLFPIARLTSFSSTILPAISLVLLPTAYIARLIRNSVTETLNKDYIKLAKVKGLSNKEIFFKHVLKNSMLPLVAYLGPLSAHVITGSFVIEKIFAIPGIGFWLVSSISLRDYSVILGLSIFFSFILIVIMMLVDILYRLIDPRIEKENAGNTL